MSENQQDVIESLRQQLDAAQEHTEYLVLRDETWKMIDTQNKQQLNDHIKREVILRDELFAVLVQDMSRDSAIAKIEALAATAYLENLILCEKEPVAWVNPDPQHPEDWHSIYEQSGWNPLYRAWETK